VAHYLALLNDNSLTSW